MLITPAYAQAAAGSAAPGGAAAFFIQMMPLALIFIIFWFLLIRPQQQRAKQHRAMIDAVKKGDSIVTGGGLVGKVTKVEGDIVEVEIASGVKVKAIKATLSDITPTGSSKPAND
ncbi:MAG: preprotein translocase subunit YajC [Sphingomonadales bacterium]|jgi:preprotein translocase subunit YajC|nr:preprotein translocase subunit YajC [Sphingomonadales bacterium]MBP7135638.1 preprotein translocase subunit YajC [Sphingomonadaceae bacterium]MBK6490852.1 preprotein translocase subunit YajC [Sphingomonadales bacterium]MBK6719192.1 preprotein translocase subunit YajC [Sphingomonadales bacterium]MBK8271454.1 preprotein translocase subunit YajC [Sphingomonadales bacterium]